jgi:hypothetical protein
MEGFHVRGGQGLAMEHKETQNEKYRGSDNVKDVVGQSTNKKV